MGKEPRSGLDQGQVGCVDSFTDFGAPRYRRSAPDQETWRSSKSPKSTVFTIVMNGSQSEIETGRTIGDRLLLWVEDMDLSAKPSPSFRERAPLRIRWARGPHSRRLRVPRLDTGEMSGQVSDW